MSRDKPPDPPRPREPFRVLRGNDTPSSAPPVPTSAEVGRRLGDLELLCDKLLKRTQQTALMVDGFGSNINRRFDVLHEEVALMRAAIMTCEDVNPPIELARRTPAAKARRVLHLSGRWAAYGTAFAVAARAAANAVPEYAGAIDGVLRVFGL